MSQPTLPPWLKPKIGFLLSGAENRASFFGRIGEIFPSTDPRYKLIERAYEVSKECFRLVQRDGGERYFEHLRAVALILIVHLRVRDPDIIAAALLHDIVEDIPGWTIERVSREFNEKVASYVFWVTKPKLGGRFKTKGEVERKAHRLLTDAPREAVLIKMSDRLHNLITIWKQKRSRILAKVEETHDFILPLAGKHQVLIHELEDVLRLIEQRYGF